MTSRGTERRGKGKESKTTESEFMDTLAAFKLPDSLPCSEVEFPVLIKNVKRANWQEIVEESDRERQKIMEYAESKKEPILMSPFIRQTKRSVGTRVKEHIADMKNRRDKNSVVFEHTLDQPNHYIRFDKPQILAKENRYMPRMLREAIEIRKHPNFNREDGWQVPPAWDPVLKIIKSQTQRSKKCSDTVGRMLECLPTLYKMKHTKELNSTSSITIRGLFRIAPFKAEHFYEVIEIHRHYLETECDYIKSEVFVHLIPALEETLNKAKIWDALQRQKCFFNGIDHIVQVLWNNNPRHPERKEAKLHLFNMAWVRQSLKQKPRPYYPKSWLWPEDYAATLIQKTVRQYFVQRQEEVQELRKFWKKLELERSVHGLETNPYLAKKFASSKNFV